MNPLFIHTKYVIRKKVFSLVGTKYHIYDNNGQLVLYSQMKAFKLKEDLRLYRDETMAEELLWIQARNGQDWSVTFDVTDSRTGEPVGALRRRGLKSMVKEEWIVLGPAGQEIGRIKENHPFSALLRRFIHLIPQHYHVALNGRKIPAYTHRFTPRLTKVQIDLSGLEQDSLDPRLSLTAGILLCSMEGRQA
jgi:hypothetical protein